MKALSLLIVLVWGVAVNAIPKELNQAEILNLTQLQADEIARKTEVSLDSHLFQEGHGRSCGLSHFFVEGYQTTEDTSKLGITFFDVITKVYGPIYLCKGYEYFFCSTSWVKTSNLRQLESWSISKTFCEDDPGAGIIHFITSPVQ